MFQWCSRDVPVLSSQPYERKPRYRHEGKKFAIHSLHITNPPISQKRLKPSRTKDNPYLQVAYSHEPIKNESTPLSTSSQFCCHTFASSSQFCTQTLHPSNKQLFLVHPPKEQPVLQSHFCIPRTSSYLLPHHSQQGAISAATPLSSSRFCSHTFASFKPAANSAVTLLHPSNKQLFLLLTSSNEQPVLLPTSLPTSCQLCHYTFASSFQKPRLPLLLR